MATRVCSEPPPRAPERPVSLAEARRYCRRLAKGHYENFFIGSLLLPARIRPHFFSIYAYCRTADDLADEIDDDAESLRQLALWEQELQRCLEGRPRHPVMVALFQTLQEFTIPARPLIDLLDAFRQDQRVKRYETFDQLLEYCRRSANPVGHLVLYLGRCFDPERAALADAVCTGLQLSNHWQDIAQDARRGRIYLPREDCQRFGVTESMLAAGRVTQPLRDLLRWEVERTRPYFQRGALLPARVPRWLAADVRLFIAGGVAALDAIERADYDVWTHGRPRVGRRTQARLLATAAWHRIAGGFG